MKKIISFFSACLLASTVHAAETWTIKAPLPAARSAFAAACIDSNIYIVGGCDTLGTVLNTMIAYNVYTNTWTTKAPMPTFRNDFFAVAVNGKLYAIGGYNVAGGAQNAVEEYDPATDTWASKAPMPTARSLFSGAAIGNKIYVTGGWPAVYATLEVYDVSTNTWATKAPLPLGKLQLHGGAALGGKFYLVGGKNYANTAFYDSCLVYNPASDSWSYGPNAPVARFSAGTTYMKGRIYHMGGGQGYFAIPNFNSNVYYDSATNAWGTALPCLYKRGYAVAVTAPNNRIYLLGGADSTGAASRWNHEYWDGITIPTGFEQAVAPGAGINLFPNPCSKAFTIDIAGDPGAILSVDMISLAGQVTTCRRVAAAHGLHVDVSTLAPGIYTVIASTAHSKYTKTVVVE